MTIDADIQPAQPHLADESFDTVVIGAGQAGLAVAHHLARRDHDFVVLDAHERVGDVWRERFDSLRLYSPARYDGLPGMRFPGDPWNRPTKDEVADYFEAYAERFSLPVRTGMRVEEVSREGDSYLVRAGGLRIHADRVVVASGTWQEPRTPAFATQLDPRIRSLHSADYRNPSSVTEGSVLVVGASHSGADIALELAKAGHETILSGRVHGEVPFDIEGTVARFALPVLWFMANRVLTERTPIGRKMQKEVRGGGGPLLRVKRRHLLDAGVEMTDARVAGVQDGRPVLEDGRVLDVASVVWCTGFGKDLSWLKIPVTGDDGWPDQHRGVVASSPGLYFVGLPFLQAFASMLVGGVGRDAEHVAKHICAQPARARVA